MQQAQLVILLIHLLQVRSYKMEKYTYEIIKSDFDTTILRSDGAFIPADPANSDYQAYLVTLVSELPDAATKKAK